MAKILLVDDIENIHLTVKAVFGHEHTVVSAYDLAQAADQIERSNFDLILLDVMLPDGSGFEFCALLQQNPTAKNIPVFFLTGKSDLSAKTIGFSLGAEDYIVKPFDVAELKLRCEARLRKEKTRRQDDQCKIGDLRLEISSHRVHLKTKESERRLQLTPTGFKLLLCFAQNEGRVFTRDQLINSVWGHGTFIAERTVDTHIATLRKQIIDSEVAIEVVHGTGYRIVSHKKIKSAKKDSLLNVSN